MTLFLTPLRATLAHTIALVEASTASEISAANILELSIKNLVIFVYSMLNNSEIFFMMLFCFSSKGTKRGIYTCSDS